MLRLSQLKLPLEHSEADLEAAIRRRLRLRPDQLRHHTVVKRSVDARRHDAIALVYSLDLELSGGAAAYDNAAPRAYLAGVEGKAQRAHWAEQNGYEAFPLFAAGVLTAHWTGAAQGSIDMLAMIFIAARIAHGFCYVADLAPIRSLVWMFGFAASIGLFVISA